MSLRQSCQTSSGNDVGINGDCRFMRSSGQILVQVSQLAGDVDIGHIPTKAEELHSTTIIATEPFRDSCAAWTLGLNDRQATEKSGSAGPCRGSCSTAALVLRMYSMLRMAEMREKGPGHCFTPRACGSCYKDVPVFPRPESMATTALLGRTKGPMTLWSDSPAPI